MTKTIKSPTQLWQLISLILACALVTAMVQLDRIGPVNDARGTLPAVNNFTGYEQLAMNPSARRAHERYSL
ncbi:MAG: hypothetical protein WCC29_00965 [Pseudomonas farsensis]|uniref:hypothetical protein n=1 Tax=Pseudomonas farsensis TaxID=2745492 RepID=UPI003C7A3896